MVVGTISVFCLECTFLFLVKAVFIMTRYHETIDIPSLTWFKNDCPFVKHQNSDNNIKIHFFKYIFVE